MHCDDVRHRGLVAMALLAALSIACQNGPDVRGPFNGQILDADTRRPIQGAIVVVVWTHVMNYFEGGRREVDAREAVTDAQGRWVIPERPTPLWEGGPAGVRRRFYVFAPGFDLVNSGGTPSGQDTERESTVTTMRRLGTREQRCKVVHAPSVLPTIQSHDRIRAYAAAIERERQALRCDVSEIGRPL